MAGKLGKHAATTDDRDFWFHDYIDTSVIDLSGPPPAKDLGHADKMPTPRLMLANGPDDTVRPGFVGCGCCVYSGYTNKKRISWNISGKRLFPGNGLTVVKNYSEGTGYDIDQTDADGNNPTDNGTNMRTMLTSMVAKAGNETRGYLGADGKRHTITAYASINVKDWNHYLWAIYLDDSGILTGVEFPGSGMQQFDDDQPWSLVKNDQPEGGHCILVDANFKAESWARDQAIDSEKLEDTGSMASKWLQKWMDEAYITLDDDGLVNGKSIEGFDSQQLAADVKARA